jgi:glycosyltransferase involved in cell wall biosynthesis
MKKISIVIPFMNEELNLKNLTHKLGDYCLLNNSYTYEVLFVDDGSTDNSFDFLCKSTHKGYFYKIIKLTKNFGAHSALRAGILNATGNYITFVYADLQDPLELINRLLEVNEKGFSIAWAARNNPPKGILESLFSKTYASLMKNFVNQNYPSKGFDVVMFNRKVQNELNNNIESNSSVFLQILNLGFKQEFISYEKSVRKEGKSKWTFSKKVKLVIDSFVAFSFAPIRFVSIIGILIFLTGVILSVYIICRKLINNDIVSGWTALSTILLLGFGITNISIGILAEYLWRTLDASRKRPVFIIEEIIKEENNEK